MKRAAATAAITLERESGLTALRKGWLVRHTVALLALLPLAFAGYAAALGRGLDSPVWIALLAALSLAAALILVTYLPLRGARPTAPSTCTVMAALLVPGAGILLSQGTGILSGVTALGILSLGLIHRVSGTSACG